MLTFINDPAYREAVETETVYFARNAGAPIPSFDVCWDTLVSQNENIHNFDPTKDKHPRVYVGLAAQHIAQVRTFMDEWSQDVRQGDPSYRYTAHLYYGDVDTATLGVHEDYVDVLFWCLHGMVEWHVPKGGKRTHSKDNLEERDSYILHPGDVIYVPTAFRHKVVSIGERFGVSFGADHSSYIARMPPEMARKKIEKKRQKMEMLKKS